MVYDLVIHNGTVITLNEAFEVLPKGMVCVKDGYIKTIEADAPGQPLPPSMDTLDADGGIIMPGLINTHTHLPMTLFRGLADDLPLHTWLNDHIFPAEQKHIHPDNVRYGTLLGCAEMITAGITTCCDGYFHEDHVASAFSTTGMRGVLGQGIIDFPAPGVPDPSQNIEAAVSYAKTWKNASSLIKPSFFCHSPYTCAEKTLVAAKHRASDLGLLFQIHAAETKTEWHQFEKEHGQTPIGFLEHLGVLDENTLLVHCVWVSDGDIDTIKKHGTKISHNPESNMKLGSGISPVAKFIDAGIPVGLGTDGSASNNNLDIFQEMDTAAKLQKALSKDPTVMNAASVLKMGTIGGARAIGWDHAIGSLETGKRADIVIVDMNTPHLIPVYNPVSHLVYAARGSDVRDVIVNGRFILRAHQCLTIDVETVMEKVKQISKQVRSTNGLNHRK
jgi:5-methylthioadenosine/S-adenosylhomocysteine deaminase